MRLHGGFRKFGAPPRSASAQSNAELAMATAFEVLCLAIGPEIDTVEGKVLGENASALWEKSHAQPSSSVAYGAHHTSSPSDYSGGVTTGTTSTIHC